MCQRFKRAFRAAAGWALLILSIPVVILIGIYETFFGEDE